MIWQEKALLKLKRQYREIAIFGTKVTAEALVEFFSESLIQKYVNKILLSKVSDGTIYFHDILIENVDTTEFPRDGLVIIASSEELKNEIVGVLVANNYMNYLHVTELYSSIELDRINEYCKYYRENTPLFKDIEIETINRCNGICNFCPVNRNEKQRPYYKMTEEMFTTIIDQLAELKYEDQVALSSNNEPFIDERIVDFAEYTREKLPKAYITLCTNGTLLTEEKYAKIMPLIDYLQIDIYTTPNNTEIPEHIMRIREIAEREKWSNKTNIVKIPYDEIRTSRAGNAPNSKVSYITDIPCILPLVQLTIRPDGKVSLCCSDALGQMTLGDLSLQSLEDVWYGDTYNRVRELILKGRENIQLCKYCNFIQPVRQEFVREINI